MNHHLFKGATLICTLLFFNTAMAADTMNHSEYDALLKTYVKDGAVNYAALKKDRKALDAYVDTSKTLIRIQFLQWSKDEQLAYLINLYNAATLQLIVDHYPVKSIKDIGSLFKGPWDQPVIQRFGETITLNDLEHEIIRKDYDEPRIHVALVCAAKSCPRLRSEAYTGADLERQLSEGMQGFLQDKEKNRLAADGKTLHLSSIFSWYGKDFTKKGNTLLDYLKPYMTEADQGVLKNNTVKLRYLPYDWSLNE